MQLTQATWKIVETWRALITPLTSKILATNACTIAFVTNLFRRAHITITLRAHFIAIHSIISTIALVTSFSRVALATQALSRLLITIPVQTTLFVTIARCTIRKSVISLKASITKRAQIAEFALTWWRTRTIRTTINVTFTFRARRPIRVAIRTLVTTSARKLWLAFAFTR